MQSQANAADAADEEDTPSMRELVKAIDAHVDLEATSNLNTIEDAQVQQPPIEDVPIQQANEMAHRLHNDPSVWYLHFQLVFIYYFSFSFSFLSVFSSLFYLSGLP